MKLVLIFLVLFSINYAQVEEFIVPDDGSVKTILEDLPLGNGAIIKIRPGTYYEQITLDHSNVTIMALDPNNKPIIDASGFTNDGVIKWTSNAKLNAYHNNVIDGLKIVNAAGNPYLRGIWINGNGNTVKNCELYNIVMTGIVVQGNNNLVENNIVDGIIGDVIYDVEGNNVSVESYYDKESNVFRTSDYNTIKNNTLKNNPTHFGVNIFPDTFDDLQRPMRGNKVYNNYIDNTGGGVFIRSQHNLEIFNNVIVHSRITSPWPTTGEGITIGLEDESAEALFT